MNVEYKMSYGFEYISSRYVIISGPASDTVTSILDSNSIAFTFTSSTDDVVTYYTIENLTPQTVYGINIYRSGTIIPVSLNITTEVDDKIQVSVGVTGLNTIQVVFDSIYNDQTSLLANLNLTDFPVKVVTQDGSGNYTVAYTDINIEGANVGIVTINNVGTKNFVLYAGFSDRLESSAPFSFTPSITLQQVDSTETSVTIGAFSTDLSNPITGILTASRQNNDNTTSIFAININNQAYVTLDESTNQVTLLQLSSSSTYNVSLRVSTTFGEIWTAPLEVSTASPPPPPPTATLTLGQATSTSIAYSISSSATIYTVLQVFVNGVDTQDYTFTNSVTPTITLLYLTPSTPYSVYVVISTSDGDATSATVTDSTTATNDPGSGSGSGSGSGGAVPCIPDGQRILTQRGLVAMETLRKGDQLVTADGRLVNFKLYKATIPAIKESDAPIRIAAGVIGNKTPIELSPLHMIQTARRGVWARPADLLEAGVAGVSRVRAGEAVTYYHVEMPDYLRDNMVVEGCVVESFGLPWVQRSGFKGSPYTWSARLNGYTRLSAGTVVTKGL